jgi:pilus assembly protein CpaE
VVRAVAADMGWPPEKCARGGLRNAVQSLSISASPAILMVDLSESGDPLNDINALAEVCEPGTVVIAVGQVNDVRLYRDLIASGIQDYLLKPLAVGQVRDALSQAQAIFTRPRTTMAAPPASMSPLPWSVRAAGSAPRRWRPRSPGRSAPISSAPPRCSISTCTSAPAR